MPVPTRSKWNLVSGRVGAGKVSVSTDMWVHHYSYVK